MLGQPLTVALLFLANESLDLLNQFLVVVSGGKRLGTFEFRHSLGVLSVFGGRIRILSNLDTLA